MAGYHGAPSGRLGTSKGQLGPPFDRLVRAVEVTAWDCVGYWTGGSLRFLCRTRTPIESRLCHTLELLEHMSKSKELIHLRFQAVVIASQLPDNKAEALLVLDYARHLVLEFLDDSSEVSDSASGTIVRDRFTLQ